VSLESLRVETPRLILRVPRIDDLDAWAAMMADEQAAQFIGGVAPREVTWRGMMTVIGAWHATGIGMFSVIEKSSGRWVGRLGPWQPEGWPGPEVGGRSRASAGAAVTRRKAPRWPPTGHSTISAGPT
jgi:RimJ/RimL family protein N-acetyltransferase